MMDIPSSSGKKREETSIILDSVDRNIPCRCFWSESRLSFELFNDYYLTLRFIRQY